MTRVATARAPGRLDLMGGIADYSGSLVLQYPIAEAATVTVREQAAPDVRVRSVLPDGSERLAAFPLAALNPVLRDYAAARAYFHRDRETAWAAYIAGALVPLAIEFGVAPTTGLDIHVASDVPEGKGVSSSAAVEVASFNALAQYFDVAVEAERVAILCQRVENLVVGAPCGIMDQMASSLGRRGQLLALLCQPAQVQGFVTIPEALAVWGIDSGVRHAVSGADYTQVRVAAFMGLAMMQKASGETFGGYLANVGVARFEKEFAGMLPERMPGAEFLAQYGSTSDSVTAVVPSVSYPVLAATRHPVHEHARVTRFRELLLNGEDGEDQEGARGAVGAHSAHSSRFEELGALMYASHDSYSACGLGADATDRVVALVRAMGPEHGLFGAKITGGGSGGTVAVLGRANAGATVRAVMERYAAETGRMPYLFTMPSA